MSHFIVNFWDLSEIELAEKDLSFQICDGCQPESCYTTVCNCTLSMGEGYDSETTGSWMQHQL